MMLYINEWERLRRRLTNEQMGRLIGSVLDALAGRDGESLDDDPALALAFELVSAQIERDGERYDALIEKRREAGRKSGAKRRQNAEQLAAGANKCEQTPAKRTNSNSNTNTNSNTNSNTNANSLSSSPEESDWLEDDALYDDALFAVPAGDERETAGVGHEDDGDEGSAKAASRGWQADSASAGMERETAGVCRADEEDERNVTAASHGGEVRAVSAAGELNATPSRGNRANGAVPAGDERETAGAFSADEEDGQRVTAAHDRRAEDRKASQEDDLAFFDAQWNEVLREAYGRMRSGAAQETRPFENADMTAGANPAMQGASQGRNTPGAQDVLEYARCARLNADRTQAERFIAEQSASNWRDSNGAPIRDWRRWFTGWLARQTAYGGGSRTVPTSMQYAMRTYTPEELARIGAGSMEMELEDE